MTCEDCDHGWRTADPDAYPKLVHPMPEDATEQQIREVYEARDRVTLAVFPCRVCEPVKFDRWAAGCFRPGHRSAACPLCLETLGPKEAHRRQQAPV